MVCGFGFCLSLNHCIYYTIRKRFFNSKKEINANLATCTKENQLFVHFAKNEYLCKKMNIALHCITIVKSECAGVANITRHKMTATAHHSDFTIVWGSGILCIVRYVILNVLRCIIQHLITLAY
jgi:hypothetical protein